MTRIIKHIWQWWDSMFFQRLWLELRWEWAYKLFGTFSNAEDEMYYTRRQQELAQQAQEAIWRADAEAWIAEHRGWWQKYGIYEYDGALEAEDWHTDSDCTGAFNRALAAEGPIDWSVDDSLPW